MDEELVNRDVMIQELRQKHARQIDELNEQLDLAKKQRTQTDKIRSSTELELTEVRNELKAAQAARLESDRKRKVAEQQLQDLVVRVAEAEKLKSESTDIVCKMQVLIGPYIDF